MSELTSQLHEEVYKALNQALLSFRADKKTHHEVTLCVALSGGVDSIVLLHVLTNLIGQGVLTTFKLEALHVNHGISEHAATWEEFCKRICGEFNVPLTIKHFRLEKVKQQSLESDARDARYGALIEHANENSLVILAQHQNDQAETFLLQLKRGAGLAGLASMPRFHTQQNIRFCRPLLNVSKALILDYAKHHHLSWQEDDSNSDQKYDRNFLRETVFPLLSNRWPSINKTIARSADHCAQAFQVNNEYMSLLAKSLLTDTVELDLDKFASLSYATKITFLRYYLLNSAGINVSKAQLDSLYSVCNSNSHEAAYMLFDDVACERFQNKLCLVRLSQDTLSIIHASSSEQFQRESNGDNNTKRIDFSDMRECKLNAHLRLKKIEKAKIEPLKKQALITTGNPEIDEIVVNQNWCELNNILVLPNSDMYLSFGGSNKKFKYRKNRPTKKLKNWYQEWGVSPLNRLTTPFLHTNEGVHAVVTNQVKLPNSFVVRNIDDIIFVRVIRS